MSIEKCDDKKCKCYGKQHVDRGYGFPVCPSSPPSLSSKPMNPEFEGTYRKDKFCVNCGAKITHGGININDKLGGIDPLNFACSKKCKDEFVPGC